MNGLVRLVTILGLEPKSRRGSRRLRTTRSEFRRNTETIQVQKQLVSTSRGRPPGHNNLILFQIMVHQDFSILAMQIHGEEGLQMCSELLKRLAWASIPT